MDHTKPVHKKCIEQSQMIFPTICSYMHEWCRMQGAGCRVQDAGCPLISCIKSTQDQTHMVCSTEEDREKVSYSSQFHTFAFRAGINAPF